MLTVYQCSLCKHLAYSRTDAEAHLKTAHAEDGASYQPVRFRCPRCGLVMNHPTDLHNHLQREHRVWLPSEALVSEPIPA